MLRNNYYIIDAHTHVFPDILAPKAVNAITAFYDGFSEYDATAGTLKKIADSKGIDHFVICSVPTNGKQAKSINKFIADCVEQSGGVFTGLGALHPDSNQLQQDFDDILRLKLHGVKTHPDMQGIPADASSWYPIYEFCEAEGIPVLMHTGDSRMNNSNPENVFPVLKRFPDLKLVAAHLGYCMVWDDSVFGYQDYDNVFFDCSACSYFLKAERMQEIIKRFGCDRVMFGTDYPTFKVETEINSIDSMDFSEEEKRKIFSENAKRFYGIQ